MSLAIFAYKSGKGFTLIEILIVLALMSLAATVSILIGIDSISRSSAQSERDLAVTFLAAARTAALANVDQSPHGVHIGDDEFVLFSGALYDAANPLNRAYARESVIVVVGPEDVVFSPLSGAVETGAGTLTFTDAGQSATVDINAVGRIEW